MNTTHIDEGAIKWLHSIYPSGFKFLDIGCGPMGMVEACQSRGFNSWGLDGDITLLSNDSLQFKNRLVITDLCKTAFEFPIDFEVIWSIEVVEHIPEEHIWNWLGTVRMNLAPGGLLIMTHATGENSGSHINCQPASYWKEYLESEGFVYRDNLTKELIRHSTMERDFIRETGMVFTR